MRIRSEPSAPSSRHSGAGRTARGRRAARSRDPGESRKRILDAAEELIAEHGFDATSTSRIAKLAGVPKGLVFHYFPTKTDLLTALVAERTDAEMFRNAELDVVADDVAGTLIRLAERFRAGNHVSLRMRRLIFREAETHPEVRGFVGGLYREATRHVREAVDAALAATPGSAEIADERREAVARAFAGLLIHEANFGPLTGETFDAAATAQVLADGLVAALPVSAGKR
ncbi:TetR/AcrR family transcriptional regulator [Actinopolymorpha alba]|uniref:TetR/AcrR family transcriptional regulator n=1 Tax=Actinopolymorpha alba TaxID=533267 RepID=UPI00035F6885|nr:TetR/AcrR family transcriptional regulator [Actinopolymorpha alba]